MATAFQSQTEWHRARSVSALVIMRQLTTRAFVVANFSVASKAYGVTEGLLRIDPKGAARTDQRVPWPTVLPEQSHLCRYWEV